MSKLDRRRARAIEITNLGGSFCGYEGPGEFTNKELRLGLRHAPRKIFKAIGNFYQVFIGNFRRRRRASNNLYGEIHQQQN
jgi:hypothetical protein